MANYKLSQDYWETSGIYDIGQGKTQRQINAEVAASTGKNDPTIVEKTATGAVATFEGTEGVPLRGLLVNIDPVQSGSGDPSPTNIRPITGWTGANVYRSGADTSNPTTYPITFPSEAGTVYGGTLDVTNGVLTVDRAKTTLTSVAIGSTGIDNLTDKTTYLRVEYRPLRDVAKAGTIFICDKLRSINNNPYAPWQIGRGTGTEVRCYLSFPTTLSTTTLIKDWIDTNHLEIVYYLATPITYTLTPTEVKTLLGQNNILADTGDVNVTYGAYLTVVEDQLGEKVPKVMIAPVLDSMTADTALSANDIRIVGDTLYRITTDVASGATLTVGTNCEVKTIGELLTSLLNA